MCLLIGNNAVIEEKSLQASFSKKALASEAKANLF